MPSCKTMQLYPLFNKTSVFPLNLFICVIGDRIFPYLNLSLPACTVHIYPQCKSIQHPPLGFITITDLFQRTLCIQMVLKALTTVGQLWTSTDRLSELQTD